MGVQSQEERPECILSNARELAETLLRALGDADPLAARTLQVRFREKAATYSVNVDGEDVPCFRTTPGPGGLRLSVRSGNRWQPTPECGSPEHLVQQLVGPLRFVWFLDAEDADQSMVQDL